MLQKRNNQQSELITSIQLEKEADFKTLEVGFFDCGDDDLNGFIKNDAWPHKEHLLAETYLIYPTELFEKGRFKPVAFVSFCNDNISMDHKERKGDKKSFFKSAIQKKLPNKKRFRKSYPAVKIARLGVSKNAHGGGIGSHILNMAKKMFLTENRTGCRFITVDAYNNQRTINFYQKNGFDFLWENDRKDETRIMWFDLATYKALPSTL